MLAAWGIYAWFRSWFRPQWSMLLPTVVSAMPVIGGIAFLFAFLAEPPSKLCITVDGVERVVCERRDVAWLRGIASSVDAMRRGAQPIAVLSYAAVSAGTHPVAPGSQTWAGAVALASGPTGVPIRSGTGSTTSTFTVVAVLVSCALFSVPLVPRTGTMALALVMALGGLQVVWLRAAWRSLPPPFRFAAPGVGVDPERIVPPLLAPVFNLYWFYLLHVGLAEVIGALLDAYDDKAATRPRAALSAVACACVVCLPLFPIGLALLVVHMRSIDRALAVLGRYTAGGWPGRAPVPPRPSLVRLALPAVISGLVLGSLVAPYALALFARR